MPTTKRDLAALHYLAQRLRAETYGAGEWHDNGLTAVLARLEGQQLALVIERVTRHAADPEARTPAAIERPFVPGPPQAAAARPPKAADACPVHPGGWRGSCSGCAADRLAPDDAAPSAPTSGPTGIARLRAELTTATATHCPCGVNRDRCTEHQETA